MVLCSASPPTDAFNHSVGETETEQPRLPLEQPVGVFFLFLRVAVCRDKTLTGAEASVDAHMTPALCLNGTRAEIGGRGGGHRV